MNRDMAKIILEHWNNCKVKFCNYNPSDNYRSAMHCLMCPKFKDRREKEKQFPQCELCRSRGPFLFKNKKDMESIKNSTRNKLDMELKCKNCGHKSFYEVKTNYYMRQNA